MVPNVIVRVTKYAHGGKRWLFVAPAGFRFSGLAGRISHRGPDGLWFCGWSGIVPQSQVLDFARKLHHNMIGDES